MLSLVAWLLHRNPKCTFSASRRQIQKLTSWVKSSAVSLQRFIMSEKELWASSVPWLPRKLMGSWGALGGVWPVGQGRFSFPSTLPEWGPIWSTVSSAGLPCSRKVRNYWRESSGGLWGWGGDWSISPTRRGWGSWACSAWRKGCEGTLEMPLNILRRMGPSSSWCPATGQGAMGTNWSRGSSVWTWGRTSSLWGWWNPGTGCPGRLWSVLLWRYSRPTWTRSCAACCRWPCFGRRVGLGDPQRSLPTPTILWFCETPARSQAFNSL